MRQAPGLLWILLTSLLLGYARAGWGRRRLLQAAGTPQTTAAYGNTLMTALQGNPNNTGGKSRAAAVTVCCKRGPDLVLTLPL